MKNTLDSTSRFLMQATLGADQKLLETVSNQGIEPWLSDQLKHKPGSTRVFEKSTRAIWQDFRKRLVATHGARALDGDGNNPALPYKWYFHMAWWDHTLSSKDDLLRQRMAQALGEILVISDQSSLELDSIGFASYYDLLYKHAFGSYVDLLYDVSMHPMMGIYLSHMHNQKANKRKNIHPDENYAREIMQLFSIGLFELNQDGSEKLDAKGKPIPTYDNRDIKELARVFTGLLPAAYEYEWTNGFWEQSYNGYQVGFDDGIEKAYKTVPFIDATKPMVVDEDYHDRRSKSLLNGRLTLPGGQKGPAEIRVAVEQLVAHPSTAPFIARNLINRLVTSNPSPDYIRTVSKAFGPTGDLKATLEAVLTYPLANEVSDKRLPTARKVKDKMVQSQKLKSPLHRVTQLLLAFNAQNTSGKLWLLGDDLQEELQMHPMSAPTVFNFYKPDFAPHGPLQNAGLVAPEFELHTSATSVAYVNQMYYWFFGGFLPLVSTQIGSGAEQKMVMEMYPDTLWAQKNDALRFDLKAEIASAKSAATRDALIDQMSILLTGRTSQKAKARIKAAFAQFSGNPDWVVQTIAFMIAVSPEFTVQEA
ncbi:DUF1800 family protein [Falsiruegeria mediterranea]|uniref:DUF1800 domain-containing protein n=1 Tax=Falsiruegeria mediterranea M17 TaxID=1200281 RepID=A0A2R8CA55_9RHOB|nr:DUF1800 family protein [Falsiruegeria mediterranea]SPJ29285.1 hypothetical protein TRM7615_02798 [Falsiruegeria mediterranea M17]